MISSHNIAPADLSIKTRLLGVGSILIVVCGATFSGVSMVAAQDGMPAPKTTRPLGEPVGPIQPQRPAKSPSGVQAVSTQKMMGFGNVLTDGSHTLTLVDTEKMHIAVYHVKSDGTIELRSSRPIDADFSLQLNVTAPLPDEIRRLGAHR